MNYFVGLFMLISVECIAQVAQNEFLFKKDSLRFIINKKNKLHVVFENSIYLYEPNLDELHILPLDIKSPEFSEVLNSRNFNVVYGNKTYLIGKGLGVVFEFKNNEINKIDQINNLNVFYDSSVFTYKNVIYSFGGYQVYDWNNLMLKFNEISNQWNKVFINQKSIIPPKKTWSRFGVTSTKLIFFGGNKNHLDNDELFSYNFNEKVYENMGEISTELDIENLPKHSFSIDEKEKIFLSNDTFVYINFYELNFKKGALPKTIKLTSDPFRIENKVYFIEENLTTGISKISSFHLSHLKLENIKAIDLLEGILIEDKIEWFLILILLLFFANLIYKGFELKKLKETYCLKQGKYITFKTKIIILDDFESSILDFMIKNRKINLKDLLFIKAFEEYSLTYKKILISIAINTLIEKISGNSNFNKIIKIEISNKISDKRIKTYQIKGNIIPYYGGLSFILKI